MNFVFLVDRLETLNLKKDTSYVLMLAAQRQGHTVHVVYNGGIGFAEGQVVLHAAAIEVRDDHSNAFVISSFKTRPAGDFEVIVIRTDPPFNRDYLNNTLLLDLVPDSTLVVNDPTGVRSANEKLWALGFPQLVPKTLVTRHLDDYLAFLQKNKNVIVKPIDGFGGEAIFLVKEGDPNFSVAFETVSRNGTEDVLVQEYLPEAAKGDKRILLLGGEIMGALVRLHDAKDHRNNFAKGATAEPTKITKRDEEIVAALKPHLLSNGLHFVGIDIIGDKLIEVNVTSPTCVQELNALSDQKHENEIIAYFTQLASK